MGGDEVEPIVGGEVEPASKKWRAITTHRLRSMITTTTCDCGAEFSSTSAQEAVELIRRHERQEAVRALTARNDAADASAAEPYDPKRFQP